MPAISKPTRFTLRITPEVMDDQKALDFCKKLPQNDLRYIIGRDEAHEESKDLHEGANRPHYHYCLEVRLSKKTLAERVKDFFQVAENSGYCIQETSWDNLGLGYAIKTHEVGRQNVLEGDITKWIPKNEFVKELKKKKKDSQPKRIEFLKYCQEHSIHPEWDSLLQAYVDFTEGYYKDWDAVSSVRYVLYAMGEKNRLKADIVIRLRKNFEGM